MKRPYHASVYQVDVIHDATQEVKEVMAINYHLEKVILNIDDNSKGVKSYTKHLEKGKVDEGDKFKQTIKLVLWMRRRVPLLLPR